MNFLSASLATSGKFSAAEITRAIAPGFFS